MFDGLEVILNIKCWVEKEKEEKKRKKREEQFSESVHCYSPTPPIGRRRPKKSPLTASRPISTPMTNTKGYFCMI